MASWNDVANFLRNNYKIAEDKGTLLRLVFNLNDGRSQVVLVSKGTMDASDEEFAQIESPVAVAREVDVEAVLKEVSQYVVGGVVQYDEALFVRHTVPLANVDENELLGPLELVLRTADRLEATHTGADRV